MADFEKHADELQARDTAIVAASVDSEADAEKMRDDEQLSFAVAHSLDMADFARRYGAFFNPDRGCLHATGFVIESNGTVAHAVYATGPIGRLEPQATIRAIDFLISKAA